MAGIVLTFPILPGKVEAWRRFCQELAGSKRYAYQASRRNLHITVERLALIETVFSGIAVLTLEAPDVAQVLGQIISSMLPFDVWYRERMWEFYGISLAGYKQFARQMPPLNQDVQFEWKLMPDGG